MIFSLASFPCIVSQNLTPPLATIWQLHLETLAVELFVALVTVTFVVAHAEIAMVAAAVVALVVYSLDLVLAEELVLVPSTAPLLQLFSPRNCEG